MDFLVFGPEEPKLVLEQSSGGGTVVRCDNRYQLKYVPGKVITWADVARPFVLSKVQRETAEAKWCSIIEELKKLCVRKVEKVFLAKIAEAQKTWENDTRAEDDERPLFEILLASPALIPQVWVNFVRYDPRDKEEAKKSHFMPFTVDFLRQGETPEEGDFKRIVVEINDVWDIADTEKDVDKFLKLPEAISPSLGKFTEHLRKDRWLRRQGWEVCRFSTLEVEKEEGMYLFFEMHNEYPTDPSYFPHEE